MLQRHYWHRGVTPTPVGNAVHEAALSRCMMVATGTDYASLHRQHVHRHAQLLFRRADDDAVDGRDVGEVAADRELDVIVRDQEIIGRIQADPPQLCATP